ncbi:hypothetical protein [Brevibacillus sp. 1238]|nr:hypothetical protein [Brevibacillus sp. 1238]
MKYFLLGHTYPDGGYIDGDVVFDPPLEAYYQVGACSNDLRGFFCIG